MYTIPKILTLRSYVCFKIAVSEILEFTPTKNFDLSHLCLEFGVSFLARAKNLPTKTNERNILRLIFLTVIQIPAENHC